MDLERFIEKNRKGFAAGGELSLLEFAVRNYMFCLAMQGKSLPLGEDIQVRLIQGSLCTPSAIEAIPDEMLLNALQAAIDELGIDL